MELKDLLDLFERAGAITIGDSPMLSEVTVNKVEGADDNVVLEAKWSDGEHDFETEFNERDLENGYWDGNRFLAHDVNGDETEICCFALVPLSLNGPVQTLHSAFDLLHETRGALQLCAEQMHQATGLVSADDQEWRNAIEDADATLGKPLPEHMQAVSEELYARFPKSDWQYEIENGDTKRSYDDWVLAQSEQAAND